MNKLYVYLWEDINKFISKYSAHTEYIINKYTINKYYRLLKWFISHPKADCVKSKNNYLTNKMSTNFVWIKRKIVCKLKTWWKFFSNENLLWNENKLKRGAQDLKEMQAKN